MSFGSFPLVAVFLGSLLEGEIVIVAGALLSARPGTSFTPWGVAAAATLGTMLGDQICSWLGRLVKDPYSFEIRGRRLLGGHRTEVLQRSIEDHGMKAVFLFRYAFGLRTAGYFLAGALRMPPVRFTLADAAGSSTWVGILVGLGYLVGRPILRALREGWALLVTVPVALLLAWGLIRLQRRFEAAQEGD